MKPYKVTIHFVCPDDSKWLVFIFILTFEPANETLYSDHSVCLSLRLEMIGVIHSVLTCEPVDETL